MFEIDELPIELELDLAHRVFDPGWTRWPTIVIVALDLAGRLWPCCSPRNVTITSLRS